MVSPPPELVTLINTGKPRNVPGLAAHVSVLTSRAPWLRPPGRPQGPRATPSGTSTARRLGAALSVSVSVSVSREGISR
jgi:hypothetical protein